MTNSWIDTGNWEKVSLARRNSFNVLHHVPKTFFSLKSHMDSKGIAREGVSERACHDTQSLVMTCVSWTENLWCEWLKLNVTGRILSFPWAFQLGCFPEWMKNKPGRVDGIIVRREQMTLMMQGYNTGIPDCPSVVYWGCWRVQFFLKYNWSSQWKSSLLFHCPAIHSWTLAEKSFQTSAQMDSWKDHCWVELWQHCQWWVWSELYFYLYLWFVTQCLLCCWTCQWSTQPLAYIHSFAGGFDREDQKRQSLHTQRLRRPSGNYNELQPLSSLSRRSLIFPESRNQLEGSENAQLHQLLTPIYVFNNVNKILELPITEDKSLKITQSNIP